MDVGLLVAGLICVAMAFGHQSIGVIWVLPSLTEERVPRTPFGPAGMTVGMLRVTWYIVTLFVLALGGLFITLAWDATIDPRALLLRWFSVTWFAATAMALWIVRAGLLRNPTHFFRLPVPLLWVVVGVLCWTAAT